jgi:SAM-dependent methyltransferase
LSDFKSFEVAGWSAEGKGLRYDALAGRVTRAVVEPLLDALEVRAGERFLDVATGPGHLAAAAAARGAHAVGVDVSPDMLALARQHHATVEFVEGDAEQLPFADDEFDAAAAAFVLHHVPQPRRVTSELLRIAPRAAVATWAPAEEQPLFAAFGAAFDDAGAAAADLPRGPSRDELGREDVLAALLPGARVFTVNFEHEFADARSLLDGFLEGSVNTAARFSAQPSDVQASVCEGFARRLDPYRRGSTIVLPVSVRVAVAGRQLTIKRERAPRPPSRRP